MEYERWYIRTLAEKLSMLVPSGPRREGQRAVPELPT